MFRWHKSVSRNLVYIITYLFCVFVFQGVKQIKIYFVVFALYVFWMVLLFDRNPFSDSDYAQI